MRLDKFLKVSRLIKRRTVANEACSAGRVLVNGKAAKAGTNVKPGDRIDIQFGNRETAVEVVSVACLLYTSDAADEEDSGDFGGRRFIKKKKKKV